MYLSSAAIVASTMIHGAQEVVVDAKNEIIEHKSEVACAVVTGFVVGVTARVFGFKAGYKYAKLK